MEYMTDSAAKKNVKHKRRYCRAPNCTRIVKSQGLCQRHGAKPRKCKIADCSKQAQGNFDGMCKAHFKESKREAVAASQPIQQTVAPAGPPAPTGPSVYDGIMPASIQWQPGCGTEMPLIGHLRAGFEADKAPAWHRNEERLARGYFPVTNIATQLEDWERELVWMEILLLTGNSDTSFRHLARAWGRDKGFHTVLAQFICERHGDVERKRREHAPEPVARTALTDAGYLDRDLIWEESFQDGNIDEQLAAELIDFSGNPEGDELSFSDEYSDNVSDEENDAKLSAV